jgi:ubiquinone/menaquinone biosynthesis C-methylase UbiE
MQGMNDALAAINIQGVETSTSHERHQGMKNSIAAVYDHYGNQSAQLLSTWGTFQFWNWGMHREAIRQDIRGLLGEFDRQQTDGHSEQLYYYTLKQAPKANGTPRRILEVGCGNGAGLNFLSRTEGRSEFVGLDLSQQAVARANERYTRRGTLSYVQGDAEQLPFDDNSFDVVINVESSHNYPNLDKFLAEASRVLRPGGYLSHVDAYTDDRLAAMESCKRLTPQLIWRQAEDITSYVQESIRRRMAKDSMLRKNLKDSLRAVPWPIDRFVAAAVLGCYGRSFANPKQSALTKLLPKRTSARWNFLSFMTSYRHSLATKAPAH